MKAIVYKRLVVALMFLSIIGFVDATYLTIEHYRDADPVCVIGPVGGLFDGCGVVTRSEYAVVLGVSVAALGALYYFLALILSAILTRRTDRRIVAVLAGLTGTGFIASLWFVYLQLFVLRALCLYCVVSACVTTLLFIGSLMLLRLVKSDLSWQPG